MKWFLTICSLFFVTALLAPQRPAEAAQRTHQEPAIPHKGLVDRWFHAVEGALTDLSTTRGRWENQVQPDGTTKRVFVEPGFGMSRIPIVPGHGITRDAGRIGDTTELREILNGADVQLAIMGYGQGTSKLTKGLLQPKFYSHMAGVPEEALVQAFVKESFDKIVGGATALKKIGEWTFQTRLVRLNKQECLNCHTENKLNDPVAIFAFGTKPK